MISLRIPKHYADFFSKSEHNFFRFIFLLGSSGYYSNFNYSLKLVMVIYLLDWPTATAFLFSKISIAFKNHNKWS